MDKNQAIKLISNFVREKEKPLLVILGPTASGKTALSLDLAKQFNGEIISADSRQVYRHMNIGTDKIPMEKREGIPHYLIDVVNPNERFTVADFKKLAEEKIDDILNRKKLPILVGGTGLYIRAITENFAIPPENREIRKGLEHELKEFGPEKLYEKLQKLDPRSAAKIHLNNLPYIMRALEIVIATGHGKDDQKNPPKYSCRQIGLAWPREILMERINARVDQQIKNGLIEEVKNLLEMGYSKDLASMQTLGYKEIIQYLNGDLTLEEAVGLIKKNTRNFAKKQMTWFKRDKEVLWI